MNDQQVPDWVLAKRGIQLLINNNASEAEKLFKSNPDSLSMYSGYSFATFIDALMTFEEDKLNLATATLKDVEKRCTSDSGWLKSMKKVFTPQDMRLSLAENFEMQIILADSQVCLAILTFLQQDISGYFKSGWVLRKSWKIYQQNYQDILSLYKEVVDNDPHLPHAGIQHPVVSDFDSINGTGSANSSVSEISPSTSSNNSTGYKNIPYSHSSVLLHTHNQPTQQQQQQPAANYSSAKNRLQDNLTFLKKSLSVNSALSKHSGNNSDWSLKLSPLTSSLSLFTHIFSANHENLKATDIDKETIQRLMGAVSFGYGLFQLGISLLPPSLLKLTNFLGFGGNRQNGIACLMYARKGVDMRAPLATLALLWYHTIVRPFYALDGSNIQAGADAATLLLEESDAEYSQSALFLFFKGRVNRLNSEIPTALQNFQLSVDNATQREIKILSLHEVGWCHLIELDYCGAEHTFSYLKLWGRWSRAFYSYLAGICSGSCDSSTSLTNIKEIQSGVITGNKMNQLEEFLGRRARCCPSEDAELAKLTPLFWKLLVYEMLYLWNALPSCNKQNVTKMKNDCVRVIEEKELREPMVGLARLILGCCYCIEENFKQAAECFEACLEVRKGLPMNSEHSHVSAFSQFELGALLIKKPETKSTGKLLLQQINQFKDYDFEQRLNVRVHSVLKHL